MRRTMMGTGRKSSRKAARQRRRLPRPPRPKTRNPWSLPRKRRRTKKRRRIRKTRSTSPKRNPRQHPAVMTVRQTASRLRKGSWDFRINVRNWRVRGREVTMGGRAGKRSTEIPLRRTGTVIVIVIIAITVILMIVSAMRVTTNEDATFATTGEAATNTADIRIARELGAHKSITSGETSAMSVIGRALIGKTATTDRVTKTEDDPEHVFREKMSIGHTVGDHGKALCDGVMEAIEITTRATVSSRPFFWPWAEKRSSTIGRSNGARLSEVWGRRELLMLRVLDCADYIQSNLLNERGCFTSKPVWAEKVLTQTSKEEVSMVIWTSRSSGEFHGLR